MDYLINPIDENRLRKTLTIGCLYVERRKDLRLEQKSGKLFVQLIDGCTVYNQNGETVVFPTSKSKEFFIYLCANNHHEVTKWQVIEDLFSDMPLEKAEVYLNTITYQIRKVLKSTGLEGVLKRSKGTYFLHCNEIYIDLADLRKLMVGNNEINEENYSKIVGALSKVRAEFFLGSDYFWSEPMRDAYLTAYTEILKRISLYCMAQGHNGTALEVQNILMRLEPYDEKVVFDTIRLHKNMGNMTKARFLYNEYNNRVEKDLNTKPSFDKTEIYELLYE